MADEDKKAKVSQSLSEEKDTSSSTQPSNDTGATSVNAPDIDSKTLKARRRAISSVDQIIRIADAMFDPQSDRNHINGEIAKAYNDAPPFEPEALKANEEDWRHNMPTGFMSGIINQVVTAPIDIIDAAPVLTTAKLSKKKDPDGSKSKTYQVGITKLIRSWCEWRTHIYGIGQEDVTFGYAAAVAGDPGDWRPRFYRQDEFGVPDGNGQHSSTTQFFAVKRDFLVDELVKAINPNDNDPEPAELAGWYVDSCCAELNAAMLDDRNDKTNERQFSDLVREGNSGSSALSRKIKCYEFYAREANGKVSKYIVTRDGQGSKPQNEPNKTPDKTTGKAGGHRLLFEAEDLFERIEHALTLYSLEPGNTKLYGSKGLGRKLINLHFAIERARNLSCDQLHMSSLMWMQSPKGIPTIQFKMRHPFGLIGSDAELQAEAMPSNIEAFLKLDERLTAFAEQAAGAYIPRKLGEDAPEKTAHEAVIEDTRENEQRKAYLKRFFGQFADEIAMICRIVCDSECKDAEAVAFRKEMEEAGLTADDLRELGALPAAQVTQDLGAADNEKVVKICEVLKTSPFADQQKVIREQVIAAVSVEFADKVLQPNGIDPNDEAAHIGLQTMETSAIRSGEKGIPVPANQPHKVHLDTIVSDFKEAQPNVDKAAKEGSLDPAVLDNMTVLAKHGEEHINKWEGVAKASGKQEELQEIETYKNFFGDIEKMIVNSAKTLQGVRQQQQEAQAMQQQQAVSAPPQQAGEQPMHPEQVIKLTETIPYDKAPPQIQRQLEKLMGLEPAYGATKENNWGGPTGGAPQEETSLTPAKASDKSTAKPATPRAETNAPIPA